MSEHIPLDVIGKGIVISVESKDDEYYKLHGEYRAAVRNFHRCYLVLCDHDLLDSERRIRNPQGFIAFGNELVVQMLQSLRTLREVTERYSLAFSTILQRIGTKEDLLRYIEETSVFDRENRNKFLLTNCEVEYSRRVMRAVFLLTDWFRKQAFYHFVQERSERIEKGEDPDCEEFQEMQDDELCPLSTFFTKYLETVMDGKDVYRHEIKQFERLTSGDRSMVDLVEYHRRKLEITLLTDEIANLIICLRNELRRLNRIHGRQRVKRMLRKYKQKMDNRECDLRELLRKHVSRSRHFYWLIKDFERENYRYEQYMHDLLRNEEKTEELEETFKNMIGRTTARKGIDIQEYCQIQKHPMFFLELLLNSNPPRPDSPYTETLESLEALVIQS